MPITRYTLNEKKGRELKMPPKILNNEKSENIISRNTSDYIILKTEGRHAIVYMPKNKITPFVIACGIDDRDPKDISWGQGIYHNDICQCSKEFSEITSYY